MNASLTSEPTSNFTFILPYNEVGVVLYASVIILLFVFGLIGNIITIVTVMTSEHLKSTWYQLITSLAFSDLISTLISPLFLYNYTWGFEVWKWSDLLCKLSWSLDLLTSYVTTMHILWFATLRFISLQWPVQFKRFAKEKGKISICVIWLIGIVAGFIPFIIIFQVYDRDRSVPVITSMWSHCSVGPSRLEAFAWYTQILYPIFYYIPFVLIVCFSVGINIKVVLLRRKRNALKDPDNLQESEVRRRQRENQMVFQLILIVGSFIFGYFPVSAFHFYIVGAVFTTDQSYWNSTWRFAITSHMLLRVSECLNPIFYNLSSSEMRQETINTIKRAWKKLTCNDYQTKPYKITAHTSV